MSSVIDNHDKNTQRAGGNSLSYMAEIYVRTNEVKDFVSNTWKYFNERSNRFFADTLVADSERLRFHVRQNFFFDFIRGVNNNGKFACQSLIPLHSLNEWLQKRIPLFTIVVSLSSSHRNQNVNFLQFTHLSNFMNKNKNNEQTTVQTYEK